MAAVVIGKRLVDEPLAARPQQIEAARGIRAQGVPAARVNRAITVSPVAFEKFTNTRPLVA